MSTLETPTPLHRAGLLATLTALVVAALVGLPGATHAAPPGEGPGGPILVIADPGDRFGRYYAEILTAEGLNAYDVRDIGAVSAASLNGYSAVILAQMPLSGAQAAMLSSWVQGGGNLIAMRPGAALAGLLGLGSDAGDLGNAYLRVDTGTGPGSGITGETMQFHDGADLWTLAGASKVADLYSGPSSGTPYPAVTLRDVGSAGGQAAAFTFDLARSVVYTRQGNPGAVGQETDGEAGLRSSDLFAPSWLDLNRVAIPQADEQQRLLANLITRMSADRMPLPRFWYLPRGERAAVVMSGDDHTAGGTVEHFERFKQLSPAGCSVADWDCVRSTSYIYSLSNLSDAQAAGYQAQGFEVALHLQTSGGQCANYTEASLRGDWQGQRSAFISQWPSVAPPRTNRTHCIVWSDWATQPKVEREFGVRLDTNYYYWPPSWNLDRPGVFTGSGIPMRFADLDGSPIDVYQATTQLVDEGSSSAPPNNNIPVHIAALLDGALGPQGYYGAFTANIHTDRDVGPAVAIVNAAQARGVPVISSAQLLDWLDGRNGSSFSGLSFDGHRLSFGLNQAAGARGLEAMLPAAGLTGLWRDGVPVPTSPRTVKGIPYAVFAATPGGYQATYGAPPAAGGGPSSSKPKRDRSAPRVKVRPRRVRATKRGRVALRVTCPRGERLCRVDLRLKRRGGMLARRTMRVSGGKTRHVTLKLKVRTRRKLARARSLKVLANATARDVAGNRATTRTRIRLLAPRRR